MQATPKEKGGASILLPLFALIQTGVGIAMLVVPIITNGYWLYVITGPFAFFLFWIARTLLMAWLNAAFSTTQVDVESSVLSVKNSPFGITFRIPLANIRDVSIQDLLSPKHCLEILLLDHKNRSYQVCAFRDLNEPIASLYAYTRNQAGLGEQDEPKEDSLPVS